MAGITRRDARDIDAGGALAPQPDPAATDRIASITTGAKSPKEARRARQRAGWHCKA
jgi:hypothetical protein